VLFAAVIGYIGSRYSPNTFNLGTGHQSSHKSFGKAVIDDDTPAPEHAKFNSKYLFKILAVGLTVWLVAMGLLTIIYGWNATFTQMGWFFTKAALMTFGGAYAVLPYVYQGAVGHYHWLSATQMMDGLALGETTPGPLIMIVAFVGFVGGWMQQVFGAESLLLSGVVAASIVTFFTFLPSFVFIFMGGPFIENTQGNLKFTGPLTAITAAVVGVILSLALFFAAHVFMPNTAILPNFVVSHFVFYQVDWWSVSLAVVGFLALFKFKLSIIKLIFIFAMIGFLLNFIH
jgi:chromate transporter